MTLMPPNYWRKLPDQEYPPDSGNFASTQWKHKLADLYVLRSISKMENGEHWIHVSVSRRDRLPNWDEVVKVKNEFIGEFKEVIHMIPSKKDHVNIHSYCLHLWSPAKVDPKLELPNLQNIAWETAI